MSFTTRLLLPLLLYHSAITTSTQNTTPFRFEGFENGSLILSNSSDITSNRLLRLTDTRENQIGHAFFPTPLKLKNSTSFSTAFVFAFFYPNNVGDHGMAFALSPSPTLPFSTSGQYLGLFNETSNNSPSSHIFAVELDTVKNKDFKDINANHVGINVNGLTSVASANASYNDENGKKKSLDLHSGESNLVWIEYNASNNMVQVTLAPLSVSKPENPLLSKEVNLSSVLTDESYVGFSASTGGAHGYHYVLGWSFSMDGEPLQPLDLSDLPRLPHLISRRELSPVVIFALVIIALVLILLCIGGITYWVWRERRFAEFIEDGEILYGPNRISYKDLYRATNGFKEENLLGAGGFGQVYKGTLPKSHAQVAVKKISHDSSQGVREFVAEITSMARLRHRNLVQLIGYCRRKGELLLVYEYMQNGSLDKFLHGPEGQTLSWEQRFKVAKGVADGLCYLHDGWEQVVVHRDVKASNVLLDADYVGRLGDFGLAKILDRGDVQQQTTRVVGTIGYIAPEMTKTGKATTFTDVYAFGAFLLEVVCGKRPVIMPKNEDGMAGTPQFLVDRVLELWRRDNILVAVDPRLGLDYSTAEAETLLKLGVLCSHEVPASRPSMRQVVQVLEGDLLLPVALPGSDSGAALATMVTVVEGETPMTSFSTPMEANSSSPPVDNRDLYPYVINQRRKWELLLVYEYMEHGSLDKLLHGSEGRTLSWEQRFNVARGVAEGLCYLHEGWEQVVVHRDVKSSNVLLDADYNGRLGDFGLAKILDRGNVQQQTTRVVGTLRYIAPEMARTGKATTFTDVYAFGVFLLEVVCGKRPMFMEQFLVDTVLELRRKERILAAVDPRLGCDYSTAEAEKLLKLGVLCSRGARVEAEHEAGDAGSRRRLAIDRRAAGVRFWSSVGDGGGGR